MSQKMLGQYELLEEIGRGGMATIYKGYQPSLDRIVAIKVLSEELCDRLEFVERFHREATAVARLTHPNIVHIIDRGEEQRRFFFVMEYVEGTTLKDLLTKGPLPLSELLSLSRQICFGLAYAHSQGVIHRDIKPGNILIDKNKNVKITDFGIAQITAVSEEAETLTKEESSMGTADYMAPEQRLDARNVDKRADLYSLGVVLYQMATGRLPIGAFALPSDVNPVIPKELDQVVLKCLQEDLDQRYGDAEEIVNDLDRISGGGKRRSIVSFARSSWFLGAGGALMGVLLLLGFFVSSKERPVVKKDPVPTLGPEQTPIPTPALTPSGAATTPSSTASTVQPESTPRADVKKTPAVEPTRTAPEKLEPTEKPQPKPKKTPVPVGTSLEAEQRLDQAKEVLFQDRDAGLSMLRKIAEEHQGSPLATRALLEIARDMERDSTEKATKPLIMKSKKKRLLEPALRAYQEVVEADSQGSIACEAWYKIGKINQDFLEDWVAALEAFDHVLQGPSEGLQRVEALVSCAQLCEKMQQYEKAIQYYEQLIEEHPGENNCAWLRIGEICEDELKSEKRALEAYQKAVEDCRGTQYGEKALQKVQFLSDKEKGRSIQE